METKKGRITGCFDGTMTDDKTGEVKTYQPSITIMDEKTFELVKIKVTPEDFKKYGSAIGTTISFRGAMVKPAKPAEYQGDIIPTK